MTGQRGQLARSLVEAAVKRPWLGLETVARPTLDLDRLETIGAVLKARRPEVVINAAAYTAVDLAEDEPERARLVNGEAAGEVARQCAEIGARLIHISTDYVFDGRAAGPYRPDSPTNPLGVYGASKLLGEEDVRAGTADHVIVRTAWVYSPFGRNFVKTMIGLAKKSDVIRVVADQQGNPSSALDLAEGLVGILELWRDGSRDGLGQTHHLAGSGDTNWAEFASAIFEACRRLGMPSSLVEPITTDEYPTRAIRPRNSRLECSAFAETFGYRMPDWRESLDVVVQRLAGESLA